MSVSTDGELLIHSEVTVGRLLRRLNAEVVVAIGTGDNARAEKFAAFSRQVEQAMVASDLYKEPTYTVTAITGHGQPNVNEQR